MENFDSLRLSILIDIIPTFFMEVRESKDCDEIRASAKKMFEHLVSSAYPDQRVTIKPIKK